MQSSFAGSIVGSEVHGFRTMEDLDMVNVLEEAKKRWLRPNEIHAILSNYNYFRVQVKPMNLPPSGTIVMYDRKKLRNFRKDGHNWKKKQDGKTVKEAHEHLKVGDEERIHVYYAHGKDNPTFVRRCYWLLDKSLEHIVLVHYRETQEGSAAAPMNSNSSSGVSDPSATWHSPQDTDFVVDQACYFDPRKLESDTSEAMNIRNQELRLHEINTLDWDELLVPEDTNKLITTQEGRYSVVSSYQHEVNGHKVDCDSVSDNKLPADYLGNFTRRISASNPANFNDLVPVKFHLQSADNEISLTSQQKNSIVAEDDLMENLIQNGLQTDTSFEIWTNEPNTDLFVSVDASIIESSISTTNRYSHNSTTNEHHLQSSAPEYPFCIADVSPSCAVSTEETKVLVVGRFCAGYSDHVKSNLFCILGDVRLPAQFVQPGVYRCIVPPQTPGVKNLFLSLDGHKPVSQVTTFEFRAPKQNDNFTYSDDNSSLEFLQVQMRLARLLFSTSKNMSILSSKASQNTLKEAENFYHRISNIENSWVSLSEAIKANQISFMQAKSRLFELTLQNRMYEWLLERVVGGSKDAERDPQGQGVIHLCAMLNYTWAVYPFSWSGLSLDYRDKFGWTALHWAACNGREKMVAKLLSAGAKASLVTDPTSENPGGCTAADLASKNGHEGLAAYLAEKGLIQHFEEMTLAGNVSGSLQPETDQVIDPVNFTDEELYLKDALAAYRTAAGAAARIQAAFREHSFKIMSKSVEESNPEDEARKIVAAMRIQHAFRNYDTKKKMVAAARIQHRFRGWKIRRDFVNMRRQAIKIQAIFRGFQIRKQYRKIIWSVGVLEKAILRWRLKRKGFRGIQVNPDELINDEKQEEGNVEEDFFKVSRQQAEERVERSVVRVQALFRSKRAQEEYRRMKLEFSTAALEYDWASTN